MPLYDYRISAGYNVAAASLTNVETIADSDGKKLRAPYAVLAYNAGQFRIRTDGTVYQAGYGAISWVFAVVTRAQVAKLSTDYCAGGYSGKVTIYTRTTTSTYARYNAVILLPNPAETQRMMKHIRDYTIRLTRMVAL